MPAKVSEKQLFLGVVSLLAGLTVLLNTTLISTPIKVSEKRLLLVAAAAALLFAAGKLITKSIQRQ